MKAKEFIIQKLKDLSNNFCKETLHYHFCKNTNTHIVKVQTQELYDSDDFKFAEADIFDALYEFDFDEELMFVSDSNDFDFIQEPYFVFFNGEIMDSDAYSLSLEQEARDNLTTQEVETYPYENGIIIGEIDSDNYTGYSDNNYALAA